MSHLIINLQNTLKHAIDPQKSLIFIHRPQTRTHQGQISPEERRQWYLLFLFELNFLLKSADFDAVPIRTRLILSSHFVAVCSQGKDKALVYFACVTSCSIVSYRCSVARFGLQAAIRVWFGWLLKTSTHRAKTPQPCLSALNIVRRARW